jgi:hypothetical protein
MGSLLGLVSLAFLAFVWSLYFKVSSLNNDTITLGNCSLIQLLMTANGYIWKWDDVLLAVVH